MIKFEDYNIICDNFNNIEEFSKDFYLNSTETNNPCTYHIAVCNHGHIFYNDRVDLIIRKYNINMIKSFGCNLLDGFKLCFIGDDQIENSWELFQKLVESKLHRIINIVKHLKNEEFKLYLDEIEFESCKIPSQISSYDIAKNIYAHNTQKLNKKNIDTIWQAKQLITDKLFKIYPEWIPTYEQIKSCNNASSKYYIANLEYNDSNINFIKNDNNIDGIICNTSITSGMKWAAENIKRVLPGTGTEI